MLLKEIHSPFSNSKIQDVMYHGDPVKGLIKFTRHSHGLWFTKAIKYAEAHYTNNGAGEIYVCYINVLNPYYPTEDEDDHWYGSYQIGDLFKELKAKGYDSYTQRGESESIAVFDTVQVYNIKTGQPM